MKRYLALAAMTAFSAAVQANIIDTTSSATVQAFQQGLTVEDFESVPTRTPQTIANYSAGNAVDEAAFVFDQITGVKFSVGGVVGTNRPALFKVGGDAASGEVVLGPVDFDGTTKFEHFIEVFFPTKVAKVGFWVNPSLGPVQVIAADTNFAFSGQSETNLEEIKSGAAGHFVGFERQSADIGGLKIFGFQGFTIDDFSFGGTTTTPVSEPASLALVALSLGLAVARRRKI